MSTRKLLLGIAGGFTAGYAAYRLFEAVASPRGAGGEHRDAQAYGSLRRGLMLAGIARSIAASTEVAFGPTARIFERQARRAPVWLSPVIFAAQNAVMDFVIDLPAEYVEDFVLERRFGLSDQPLRQWISDKCKQDAIAVGVALVIAGLFSWTVRRWPRDWPWIASAATFPLLVLANVVVPIYIMPLFNTYAPIEGPLEQRLRALATRFGVGDAQILRMDMSKQTKKANAFVTGIGGTHRIVVGDTLIEHFPPEEIEYVVAHELGHYVAKDSWRLIAAAQAAASIVLFGSFAALGDHSRKRAERPVTLAQIQWWAMLFGQLLRPAVAAFSRSREWAADRFALRATHTPQIGISAFARLRDQNLAEDEQPGWYEALFATHPSLKARIAALSPDTRP